jgi:hypothetical protein
MGSMNFTKGYEEAFYELFLIHKSTGENSKGNDLRMPICPLGVHEVKITEVKLKKKKTTLFIQLSFQPSPEIVDGKKERIAVIVSTLFEETVNDIGRLYDHTFKPKPETMEKLEYLQHVCRRLQTWIGVRVQAGIAYDKSVFRDAYGDMEVEGVGHIRFIKKIYYPRIMHPLDFKWANAIKVTETDKKEFEEWYRDNGKKPIPFSWQTF